MERQVDLKAGRVDRICICRMRRRTFQGGAHGMSIETRVEIVCTLQLIRGVQERISMGRIWAILSLRSLGPIFCTLFKYKYTDVHSIKKVVGAMVWFSSKEKNDEGGLLERPARH